MYHHQTFSRWYMGTPAHAVWCWSTCDLWSTFVGQICICTIKRHYWLAIVQLYNPRFYVLSFTPTVLTTLPRYMNDVTSSICRKWCCLRLCLLFQSHQLGLACIDTCSPILFASSSRWEVFSCICLWLCDRNAKLSAKCKSSNCSDNVINVHYIAFLLPSVVWSNQLPSRKETERANNLV